MGNAIDLLHDEHRQVDALFAEYDADGDGTVVDRIATALTRQNQLEERVIYPMVRERLPEGPVLVADAHRAHETIKSLLAEAEDSTPLALPDVFDELRIVVRRHTEVEESMLMPRLREVIGDAALEQLGAAVEQERASMLALSDPGS
jgi:hemerythrin superfamily protein